MPVPPPIPKLMAHAFHKGVSSSFKNLAPLYTMKNVLIMKVPATSTGNPY